MNETPTVLHPLEPGLDQTTELVHAVLGQVRQAAFETRPDPFDRVELQSIGRQPKHRQPRPTLDHLPHGGAAVGVEVVPPQSDHPGTDARRRTAPRSRPRQSLPARLYGRGRPASCRSTEVLPRLGRTDAGGAEPPRCPRTSTITRGASRPLVILDVHRGGNAGERPGSPPTGAALW